MNVESLRLDPIELFLPGVSDDERALRRRIHKAQGAAASAATHSEHWRARAIFWTAGQFASDWTFRPAPVEDLREVIDSLARLFVTARAIERLEPSDA